MRRQQIVGPLFAVLVLGLSIGGLIYLQSTKPMAPVVQEEEKAWPVNVAPVVYDAHRPQLTLLGHVESPRVSRMSAAVEADVLEVYANEGQRIEAASLLVTLDPAETALTLLLREAEIEGLEAQVQIENNTNKATLAAIVSEKRLFELNSAGVEREQKLIKQKLGAESRLDSSQILLEKQSLALNARQLELTNHNAKLKQLQADLKRARSHLARAVLDRDRTRIVAPFSGRISKLHVSPGERVNPGSPVIDIYAADRLEIRALIPERYLTAVTLGLRAGGTVRAWTTHLGEHLELALDRFAGTVDQARGGTDGIFTIIGEAAELPLGKAMPITLDLPPIPNTLGLPMQALFSDNRVYKVVDDRLEVVGIKKLGEGLSQNGAAMVIAQSSGLRPGDLYLTTQLPNPVTGLKVRVINVFGVQGRDQGSGQDSEQESRP